MYTLNMYYSSKEEFKEFVYENELSLKENILIQIFSCILQEDKLNTIRKIILELLPNAVIIGSTTDGEILNDRVTTDKTVISCSVFE
ncbi:MAG: diguanylate cyclase, partial [Campylobacterota bacterium]|nr:diguanylate cyclase [Campylobacterota bacterium]